MEDIPRTQADVLAIVGPTAVGKTMLAEELAVLLGGEIVSADSMQIYRGMDIGTAKPPVDARKVPYHCIDLVDPGQSYSAALFQTDARDAIGHIASRGLLPIVCGGTGLYVRAALDDWEFPGGSGDTPERRRLEALAGELGPDALHALLARTDPEAAAAIHPNNVRRVVRALEMAATGVSYAGQAARFSSRRSAYPTTYLGLTIERSELYDRIDRRVDQMVAEGLVAEVERLLAEGSRDALTATQAIGYKEIVLVLEDGASLEDAVVAIKQATRRYAKRQLTWFRSDSRIEWLDVTGMTPDEIVARGRELVESRITRSAQA